MNKHYPVQYLLLLLLPLLFGFGIWSHPEQPAVSNPHTLLPHPLKPGYILLGSPARVLEGPLRGEWSELFQLPSGARTLNQLLMPGSDSETLLIAADSGLFEGNLKTRTVRMLFQTAKVFTVASDPVTDRLYAGTEHGLYTSIDRGKTWALHSGLPTRQPVPLLVIDSGQIFAATPDKLFRKASEASFETVMVHPFTPLPRDAEKKSALDFFSDLTGCLIHPDHYWLATSEGAFISEDRGQTWNKIPDEGLLDRALLHLTLDAHHRLIAATAHGIYFYHQGKARWESVYQGLTGAEILDMELFPGEQPSLGIVTSAGFQTLGLPEPAISFHADMRGHPEFHVPRPFDAAREPTVLELQRAVIRYQRLDPRTTTRWQWSSRMRALLPSFSIGHDISEGNNISIDRGSTSDPDVFIAGPEKLDSGWDFSLSWDLSDLVFSTAQTSIDSRNKINSELRRELLGETIRIFFERRRLQTELLVEPQDADKALRVEELTALLDSLSGGWFSAEIIRLQPDDQRHQRALRTAGHAP